MLILDKNPIKGALDAMFQYRIAPKRWLLNPILLKELEYDTCVIEVFRVEDDAPELRKFLGLPIIPDWNEPFEQMNMEKILLRSVWDDLPSR
jgi:hypothetical protein